MTKTSAEYKNTVVYDKGGYRVLREMPGFTIRHDNGRTRHYESNWTEVVAYIKIDKESKRAIRRT